MAANPVQASSSKAARITEIVGTVAGVITEIERLIAATGVGESLNLAQIERLTALFGSLAGVAIQAAHDVAGKPITPDSVLSLLPSAAPLADPAK